MIKRIRQAYFTDANYGLLYMHRFFYEISNAARYVFAGPYLLNLGMPLHFVLLFYGLEFGLRGALSACGMVFLNRVGVIKALFTSALFLTLFFLGLSFAAQNLYVGFFSFILLAISGGIYYPFSAVMGVLYIKNDHNRAKQVAMSSAAASLGGALGAGVTGFLIYNYGFGIVVGMIAFSLLGAILPFLKLHSATQYARELKVGDIYRFLASAEFRPLWPPFFGQQLMIILHSVMAPIFIYTIVGRLDDLGYLMALAIVVDQMVTLFSGHFTDKTGARRMINWSGFYRPLAWAGYIVFAKTPFTAFLVETYSKVTQNAFDTAMTTGMHLIARRDHAQRFLLMGTCWQMALCFGEIVVLPLYALIAYFIGMKVFYVACGGAAIGLALVIRFFNRKAA